MVDDTTQPTECLKLRGEAMKRGFRRQQDLADAMGVTLASVNHVMRGWQFPSETFQVKCAAALGMPVKELAKLL